MEPPGSCSVLLLLATLAFAVDNSFMIVLFTKNLSKAKAMAAIVAGVVAAVVVRGAATFALAQVEEAVPIKLIGGIVLIAMIIWQMRSHTEQESKSDVWGAIGAIILADLVMSLDNTFVIVSETKSTEMLLLAVFINIPILIGACLLFQKLIGKCEWVLNLATAVLLGTAVSMIASDSVVAFAYPMLLAVVVGMTFFSVVWAKDNFAEVVSIGNHFAEDFFFTDLWIKVILGKVIYIFDNFTEVRKRRVAEVFGPPRKRLSPVLNE